MVYFFMLKVIEHLFYAPFIFMNYKKMCNIWMASVKHKICKWIQFSGTSCNDKLLLDIHTFDYKISTQSKTKTKWNSNIFLYIFVILWKGKKGAGAKWFGSISLQIMTENKAESYFYTFFLLLDFKLKYQIDS